MLKDQFASLCFVRISMVVSWFIFCWATLVRILHACNFIFLNFQFSVHKLKSPQDPMPKKNPSVSQIFFPSMLVITTANFLLFLCPFVWSLHRFSSLKSQYYSLVFHLGFLLFGFCIAELLLILFCFCFPFGFAGPGMDIGGGQAPLVQIFIYIYIFFK